MFSLTPPNKAPDVSSLRGVSTCSDDVSSWYFGGFSLFDMSDSAGCSSTFLYITVKKENMIDLVSYISD